MSYIVFIQHRPFSYKDFLTFEVEGRVYHMKHGTYRNKISKLKGEGIVQQIYRSHISYHTLNAEYFENTLMTYNHTVDPSVIKVNNIVNFINTMPLDKNSVHDIHMKLHVPGIWKIVSQNEKYTLNSYSKDIRLDPFKVDNLKIQTTIHHSDTVSVVVGCSMYPVVLDDVHGIIRLSNALTRVEERISRVLDESGEKLSEGYERIPIPSNEKWLITLWHLGRDTFIEYSGKDFLFTWGHGREALYRIYTKELGEKKMIRSEIQERPNTKIGSLLKIVDPKDDIHALDYNQLKRF